MLNSGKLGTFHTYVSALKYISKHAFKKDKMKDCCKKPNGFLSGLFYGLIPHAGCIAFILFTILGVSTATAFFRPLLMSRYFFPRRKIVSGEFRIESENL